jgi:hypothetical protein
MGEHGSGGKLQEPFTTALAGPEGVKTMDGNEYKTTKPCVLTATVNDVAVQRKFMLLSGEICLTSDRKLTSQALVYKCLGL